MSILYITGKKTRKKTYSFSNFTILVIEISYIYVRKKLMNK